jgi:hypothetical protein
MDYKFLIYTSYSYAIPIGRPLELEILSRGYQVCWFTYIPETKAHIPKDSKLLATIQEVVDYDPDIILSVTDYVPDFLSGLKVQVFHGFNPDKRGDDDHFNIRGFYDLYCTQGPSTTGKFLEKQKEDPHFEVVETGWSKMDPLFEKGEEKSCSLPVILITSTFSHRLSLALREDVLEEVKRLATTGKYQFITVLHPKLDEEIIQKWKALNGPHFTFYDTTDLVPLFKRADIMLSDTTSAIQEFMLADKPIVTFRHRKPNPCVIDVTEARELEAALDQAILRPAEQLNAIRQAADFNHPYRDGKSSKRVIDACIMSLHKDKSHLKNKSLNIIRKYKIRKLLQYYPLKTYRKPAYRPKQ